MGSLNLNTSPSLLLSFSNLLQQSAPTCLLKIEERYRLAVYCTKKIQTKIHLIAQRHSLVTQGSLIIITIGKLPRMWPQPLRIKSIFFHGNQAQRPIATITTAACGSDITKSILSVNFGEMQRSPCTVTINVDFSLYTDSNVASCRRWQNRLFTWQTILN